MQLCRIVDHDGLVWLLGKWSGSRGEGGALCCGTAAGANVQISMTTAPKRAQLQKWNRPIALRIGETYNLCFVALHFSCFSQCCTPIDPGSGRGSWANFTTFPFFKFAVSNSLLIIVGIIIVCAHCSSFWKRLLGWLIYWLQLLSSPLLGLHVDLLIA